MSDILLNEIRMILLQEKRFRIDIRRLYSYDEEFDIADYEERSNCKVIQIILKDWGEYIKVYIVTERK